MAYIWKGNSPIVKAIPSSMVISLLLAEKQREFWQSVKDCFILKSTKWKSNTDQNIHKH